MNSDDALTTGLSVRREERSCPGCTAGRGRPFGQQQDFRWLRCPGCRTLYVSDALNPLELSRYYEHYYDEPLDVPSTTIERLGKVVASFESARATGRFMDVGFGAGTLMSLAAARGWECWGTEMSPEQVEMGRSRGWAVHEGGVGDWDLPPGHFDVVCMVEVIEHLPEPEGYLEAVARVIRPGGLFYCTTPNGGSLSARFLRTRWSVVSAPEHLQLFTLRGLELAARRHGLSTITARAHGINPSELLGGGKPDGRSRVESAYDLNQRMESGRAGRALKAAVNAGLTRSRLGDSLKVLFRKSED